MCPYQSPFLDYSSKYGETKPTNTMSLGVINGSSADCLL